MTTLLDPIPPADSGAPTPVGKRTSQVSLWRMLWRDKLATAAALTLLGVVLVAVIGPFVVGDAVNDQDLTRTKQPPFHFDEGWLYVLGTDSLGRSMVAQLVMGARTTLSIAIPAVLIAAVIGSVIGMWAGYHRGWRESIAMRVADVLLSFPSLLLAVVILYVFEPSAANIVMVLVITRIPVYLRTARAEAAELQSRTFVDAARTFGACPRAIIGRHVFPIVLPTMLTVATLEFGSVTLAESSLSFLGIGIQPPGVSWGLMVAQGQPHLRTAWWLAFFPGIAIVTATLSATVLAAWVRIATDPDQRWRLTVPRRTRRRLKKEATR
jgi:peptide/nickel transport system permease protein